jgi:hypothetical protein
MSDFAVTAKPTGRVTLSEKITAKSATIVARVLSTRSPARLQRVLERVRGSARPATLAEVSRSRDAVLTVSVRCSGRWCLERSIAIALVCRVHNAWPEWHAGVATEPFRAHAWVAVDGQPVGESPGLTSEFIPTVSVVPDHQGGAR